MRILAFEPYDDGSHRAVRDAISNHSRHDWTWLTRPARAWKWRMRTAAIEMLEAARRQGLDLGSFDLLFTTSLLSGADLRALLPSESRRLPLALYMHENQLAYPNDPDREPQPREDVRDQHFGLTNLTSVLAADVVFWNSDWNRRSFLDGITALLRHQPDGELWREDSWRLEIDRKSRVLWPPVEVSAEWVDDADPARVLHNPPVVVWPHRWEHDKGPDRLLAIARQWAAAHPLKWIILGQQFRTIPPSLEQFRDEFKNDILHMGFVEHRAEYLEWLSRADWVLSTARHEFFGIAVVEAMLMGCLPWLPATLSYPELLPECARELDPSEPPRDVTEVRRALRAHLEPACAHNAVRHLDDALSDTVDS